MRLDGKTIRSRFAFRVLVSYLAADPTGGNLKTKSHVRKSTAYRFVRRRLAWLRWTWQF